MAPLEHVLKRPESAAHVVEHAVEKNLHARGVRGGGKFADRLHHTGLVIGDHNAHERDVVAEQINKRGRLNVARAAGLHQVDGKAGGSQ